MRLYLDCVDLRIIPSLFETGLFYGITSNPLTLKSVGLTLDKLSDFADKVFDMGAKEIYFQSWGQDWASLYSHGQQLASISSKVVVKLPATRDGLRATSKLSDDGIKTCVTAVHAPFQALLAASVGAGYVAPYLGRMNAAERDGHAIIAQIAEALRNTHSAAQVLAASVRTPEDIAILAQNGISCITLSAALAESLFEEPLTIAAAEAFEAAAKDIVTLSLLEATD